MADSTTTADEMGGTTTAQTGSADPSGKAAEPRTFTQEQVDNIVRERLARAKATPPADYEELKAKAARLDEIEDAQKSELERITEQATKASADAADWQARYEELQATRQHEVAVRKAASEYGVDADVLMRMGGDVEDNAKLLQSKEAARPKFGDLRDGGEHVATEQSLDEALKGARNQQDRIRIRAEYKARNRK